MMLDLTNSGQSEAGSTMRDDESFHFNTTAATHFSSQHNLSVVEMHYARQVESFNAQQVEHTTVSDSASIFKVSFNLLFNHSFVRLHKSIK